MHLVPLCNGLQLMSQLCDGRFFVCHSFFPLFSVAKETQKIIFFSDTTRNSHDVQKESLSCVRLFRAAIRSRQASKQA